MDAADEVVNSALTKALIANAQDLGISWNLRIATVAAQVSGPLIDRTVNAVFDGDSVPITMTNMTGVKLIAGTRVYVIMIPTLGNFITGFADIFFPAGTLGANIQNTAGGPIASSNGAEVAVPSLTWTAEPTFTFPNRHVFRLIVSCFVNESAGALEAAQIKVRLGSASTAGTLLMDSVALIYTSNGNSYNAFGFCRNVTGAAVASKLSLTIQRYTGAGTVNIFAASNIPTVVEAIDLGSTDNPALDQLVTIAQEM